MKNSMIIDTIYAILPIIVAVAIISFFAGSLWYIFSGDAKYHKQMGMKFILPAIIAVAVSLVILLLIH